MWVGSPPDGKVTEGSVNQSKGLGRDVLGGFTTFLTMTYVAFVIPTTLSEAGMPFSGVLTATVLLTVTATLLMGVYADLPVALAPGLGINAFFTYSLILGQGVPWPTALGMVFWSGVLFLLMSATPLREMIVRALPDELRLATAAGIGVFLTMIGLKNAGIIRGHPSTLLQMGAFDEKGLVFLVGLIVTLCFWARPRWRPLSLLIGIVAATACGFWLGVTQFPGDWFALPDVDSVLFKMDLSGALKLALLPAILSLCFADLFDSLSTFIALSKASGLVDAQGNPRNLKQGLVVDAAATLLAAPLGTSSGCTYLESAAGIEAGAHSGRAAIVTALCFLPLLFIGPLAGVIPAAATAPALVLVGFLMFSSLVKLPTDPLEKTLPAFFCFVMTPLTFSITQGILWGFVTHAATYLLVGRGREIKPMMLCLAVLAAILLSLEST